MSVYILGGGLSGLIAGYLLKGTVITDKIGGQLNSRFPLGPRILDGDQDDIFFLLSSLGMFTVDKYIQSKFKTFRIGYDEDGHILTTPPKNFRKDYYLKTRGRTGQVPDSIMSGDKRIIRGWDINEIGLLDELYKVLSSKSLIREGEISGLGKDYIEIYTNPIIHGFKKSPESIKLEPDDIVINTLSFPVFLRLLGRYDLLDPYKARSTTFSLVDWSASDDSLSYVYVSDQNIPYHRINILGPGKPIVLESKQPLKDIQVIDSVTIPNCQIVSGPKIGMYDRFFMLGRYAQWNHEIKTESVIRRVRAIEKTLGTA